ncbi:MAG: hypothetical protein OYH77_01000 [Pseudomonadota bacterium]|nr:hypothetical protein [Pseudomonadota bacterium]
MISDLSTHQLRDYILEQGRDAVELRQVKARLRKLLPQHLQSIQNSYRRRGLAPARALRAALTDADYLEHVEETLDIGVRAHDARLRQELATMMYTVCKHKPS